MVENKAVPTRAWHCRAALSHRKKATLPVALGGNSVAFNFTLVPNVAGLGDTASTTVVLVPAMQACTAVNKASTTKLKCTRICMELPFLGYLTLTTYRY